MDNDQAIRYSELTPGLVLPTVSVHAVNTAVGSGIHDDAEAAKFGYRGGLVPGPTVYSYVNQVLRGYLGSAWLTSGQMTISFAKPIYDGGNTTAGAVVTKRDATGIDFDVWAENEAGERCARGTARFPLQDSESAPARPAYVVEPAAILKNPSWPRGELPIGIPFTPRTVELDADASRAYAHQVGEDDGIYSILVHPGVFISQSIRMRVERPPREPDAEPSSGEKPKAASGPGMHVGSEVISFRPATVGGHYTFYGTYADTFEKKGNRYGISEIIAHDDADRCVFRTRNTFIFRLTPKQ